MKALANIYGPIYGKEIDPMTEVRWTTAISSLLFLLECSLCRYLSLAVHTPASPLLYKDSYKRGMRWVYGCSYALTNRTILA